MSDTTEDSKRPPASARKRSNPLRLILLLVTLAVMVIFYLPLRVSRANERLKVALLSGDNQGVRDALNGGADPDLQMTSRAAAPGHLSSMIDAIRLLFHRALQPAPNSKTALMQAANYSKPEMVEALLQHGAHVNTRLNNGTTALLLASNKRSLEILTALLAKGANLHDHMQDGATPLLLAAQYGQTQNIRLFLEKGADIHDRMQDGTTALLMAVQYGQTQDVRLLLEKGAYIHEADDQSQTALTLATENRKEELIQFLLTQGANESDLRGARMNPNNQTMRLIGTGPGGTVATLNGRTTMVRGGRAPLSPPQGPAVPPLLFAAKYGSMTLLKYLWERTDPNVKQQDGWRLLNQTVLTGNTEAIRFLLDQHLAVNPPPLPSAAGNKPIGLIDGYDPRGLYTPLHYAAALPKTDIARILIARGAHVNAEDMSGTTPLMAAAIGGHAEMINLLLAHGAIVNVSERETKMNILMRGCSNPEIVKILLDHGLDLKARDRSGRTALIACYRPEIAELLIARGAEINARDLQGNTPLITMANLGHREMVALLLAHGADVNIVNKYGETALSVAHSMHSQPIIDMLTAAGATR